MNKNQALKNGIIISPCKPNEYKELLAMLDLAFGKKEKHWFPQYYGHIFQNNPETIACNHVARKNGKIVGAIGIYPFSLKVGKALLSVAGIGSVSTHPDYRGLGVMSHLLDHVMNVMRTTGYDLSWLSGNRFRYGNYGWYLGGKSMLYQVGKEDLKKNYSLSTRFKVVSALEKDISELSCLQRKSSFGVPRTTKAWALLIKRAHMQIVMLKGSSGSAFLGYYRDNPAQIFEIQGSGSATLDLISKHFDIHNINQVTINYPCINDEIGKTLFKVASNFSIVNKGSVQAINPVSVWKKLLPEIYRQNKHLSPAICKTLATVNSNDCAVLVQRILGFCDTRPPLPHRLQKFEFLRPVGWWLSDLDCV